MVNSVKYAVIYDGNCNLCVTLVQLLENLDQGGQFQYVPMQDQAKLEQFEIVPQDCELGMILLNVEQPNQRWQGSNAAEEIGRLMPLTAPLVATYQSLPGLKWTGDRCYEQIRDNRYIWFGKRDTTYQSRYPCDSDACQSVFGLPKS